MVKERRERKSLLWAREIGSLQLSDAIRPKGKVYKNLPLRILWPKKIGHVQSPKCGAMETGALDLPQTSHRNGKAYLISKEAHTQTPERKTLNRSTIVTLNHFTSLHSEVVVNFPPQPSEMTLNGQINVYRSLAVPVIVTFPPVMPVHSPTLRLLLFLVGLLKMSYKNPLSTCISLFLSTLPILPNPMENLTTPPIKLVS